MSLKRFRTLGATGIFVLLLGVPVPAATAAPLAQSASSGGLYVALGDSVQDSGNPTFPERLLTHYQSTLGVTDLKSWFGGTSEDLRTGGALASALEDINAESDTKVVTIDNGGHDALGGCDFTSPSCPFRANFSATLGDLQAALANDPGDEPLIAMAYYNNNVGEPREAMADRRLLGTPVALSCADTGAELGLNDTIAQEADRHRVLLADPYPAFKQGAQTFMADDIHPNDAGVAAITEAFVDAAPACSRPYTVSPPPDDGAPPDLQLSGKKRQNPQADKFCDRGFCDVKVKVSCGDEACTGRAKGKLTKVKKDKLTPDGPRVVAPGETATLGPELTKKSQRKQARKALAKGKKVKAKVTVKATDAAGNVATAKRTIRLVK